MNLINLTPHEIVVYREDSIFLTIPSSGFVRANEVSELAGNMNGIPVKSVSYGAVQEMPEPREGAAYVVSQITAAALKSQGRTEDIYIVTDSVRDEEKKIIGCRSFAQI